MLKAESGYANLEALLENMLTNYRDRLATMLRKQSLLCGRELTLSSGQKSTYYFDCKRTTLDPEGAFLTGHVVLETLKEMGISPDAIGGMTMGADPIVSATVVVSRIKHEVSGERPLPGFLIRKEAKTHGLGKQVEGFDISGRRVVIIDEVCTEGTSILEGIEAARRQNCEILGVVSLVDREQGGSEKVRRLGFTYFPIFTARELMRLDEAEVATAEQGAIRSSARR